MAKNSIRDYDATAANNTDVQSTDISEGCAASGINNAIREVMADLKDVSTGTVALETPAADRLDVDNLRLDGNTISSTDTNGDITIDPDGTGGVTIASGHDLTVDTDALFVDASANSVGIGTDTPTTFGDSNTKLAVVTETSNANDVNIRFGTNDVKGIIFVNDVSGDGVGFGTTTNDHVQFNTNNTERMRLDTTGRLAIAGTGAAINADSKLAVHGMMEASTAATKALDLARTDGSGSIIVFRRGGGAVNGTISISGTSTSYNTSSDHRLKENAVDMTGAITRVKALAPKRFNFIIDDSVTVDGFLAHEAQTVVPEAVTGTHDEVDADGNAVYQGIDQAKLVPLLTGALQEAIAKIETLETQRADLEARLTALENA